jgi:hypothetical protein
MFERGQMSKEATVGGRRRSERWSEMNRRTVSRAEKIESRRGYEFDLEKKGTDFVPDNFSPPPTVPTSKMIRNIGQSLVRGSAMQRAQRGLFAGKQKMYGNNVSYSNKKYVAIQTL